MMCPTAEPFSRSRLVQYDRDTLARQQLHNLQNQANERSKDATARG